MVFTGVTFITVAEFDPKYRCNRLIKSIELKVPRPSSTKFSFIISLSTLSLENLLYLIVQFTTFSRLSPPSLINFSNFVVKLLLWTNIERFCLKMFSAQDKYYRTGSDIQKIMSYFETSSGFRPFQSKTGWPQC